MSKSDRKWSLAHPFDSKTEAVVPAVDVKYPYVQVERRDTHPGLSCYWPIAAFSATDELDGAEEGEEITLTFRMMTAQEFEDLGDFDGW